MTAPDVCIYFDDYADHWVVAILATFNPETGLYVKHPEEGFGRTQRQALVELRTTVPQAKDAPCVALDDLGDREAAWTTAEQVAA